MMCMDAPTAVYRVRSMNDVRRDFLLPRFRNGDLADIHGNDKTRDQEHRSSIFACPMPVLCL
jgi:hypothetical protein